MYNVEEWAEIRRLHFSEKLGIKTTARRLGVDRNTVRDAVRSEHPPAYRRDGRGSAVDAVEEEIRRLLRDTPDMAASVIAERIGWGRGMTVLRQRVAELRPAYQLPDPCQRTEYRPGEIGQYDLWFPPTDIPVAHDEVARPPVFVGVSCYSRFIAARMIPSSQAHDVLGGHLHCVRRFGATPRTGVYDQEPAIGHWRGAKATFTQEFAAFRGLLGMGAVLCARADPEAKGVVERANRYLETSFLPGRRFADPDDFNAQLEGGWSRPTTASMRPPGPVPPSASGRTRGGWWPCRPCCRTRRCASACCLAETTTCGSTPTTTPCTPASSAAGWRCASDSTRWS